MAQLHFTGRLFECDGKAHTFEEMIDSNRETLKHKELGRFSNLLLNLELNEALQFDFHAPRIIRIQ